MKNAFKLAVVAFAGIVGILIVIGLMLPKGYLLSREIMIDAEPEKVHVYVGDLKKWDSWSPWTEEDPTLKVTVGDKWTGVGATQSWVGKGGDGSLELTASDPDRGIEYDLYFDQGSYKCIASMLYERSEGSTRVTWWMKGEMPDSVLGGYFALFMDPMAGPMFERGLANLKQVVEMAE